MKISAEEIQREIDEFEHVGLYISGGLAPPHKIEYSWDEDKLRNWGPLKRR